MKLSFTIVAVFLFLISCDENIVDPNTLKGSLEGYIFLVDEVYKGEISSEGISVSIQNSEQSLSSTTNSEGNFKIENIPQGTYNILISKNGYGSYQLQGFTIVGGDKPLYIREFLFENSSTEVNSLKVQTTQNNSYLLQGVILHDYNDYDFFPSPIVQCYIHTDSNPSNENYLETFETSIPATSASEFSERMFFDRSQYAQGTRLYLIAYGKHYNDYGYYDLSRGERIYTSLGRASEVISFTIQ